MEINSKELRGSGNGENDGLRGSSASAVNGVRSMGRGIFENRIACEWLSTKEAAHFLRLSENALRIMVHRGQVRSLKLGRRLRFRQHDCEALFKPKGT
jgi:excisionase family DNA binding protein